MRKLKNYINDTVLQIIVQPFAHSGNGYLAVVGAEQETKKYVIAGNRCCLAVSAQIVY